MPAPWLHRPSPSWRSSTLGVLELSVLFPSITVTSHVPATRAALLAVKPGDVPAAARDAAEAGATRMLSIAAGVRLATIEAVVGPGVAVVRAMPNTPALVRLGASAIAAGSAAGDDDVAWAESILAAVGTVERMSEGDLDLFTGVAGSGPAYVFLVAEALTEAAVAEGNLTPGLFKVDEMPSGLSPQIT